MDHTQNIVRSDVFTPFTISLPVKIHAEVYLSSYYRMFSNAYFGAGDAEVMFCGFNRTITFSLKKNILVNNLFALIAVLI